MIRLSSEGAKILLQMNLLFPQVPALYDKGHNIFDSHLSPGQGMPSTLPYSCIIQQKSVLRDTLVLVTEDETGAQVSPPPGSLPCFSQAVFNHIPFYATPIPCLFLYCST